MTKYFNFCFVVKALDMQICIWSEPFVVLFLCCNKMFKIEIEN